MIASLPCSSRQRQSTDPARLAPTALARGRSAFAAVAPNCAASAQGFRWLERKSLALRRLRHSPSVGSHAHQDCPLPESRPAGPLDGGAQAWRPCLFPKCPSYQPSSELTGPDDSYPARASAFIACNSVPSSRRLTIASAV